MRSKKQFRLLAAAVPIALAIGCGSAPQDKANTGADSTTKATTTATGSNDIAVLKALFKAYNEKDTAHIASFYADNYVEYGDGSHPPKTYPTPDSIVIEFKEELKIIPDFKSGNEEYFSGDSGKIMVVDLNTGTWSGAAVKGQKATGKTFKYYDADIFTLKDGKITSHKNIYPAKAVGEQVGFKYTDK